MCNFHFDEEVSVSHGEWPILALTFPGKQWLLTMTITMAIIMAFHQCIQAFQHLIYHVTIRSTSRISRFPFSRFAFLISYFLISCSWFYQYPNSPAFHDICWNAVRANQIAVVTWQEAYKVIINLEITIVTVEARIEVGFFNSGEGNWRSRFKSEAGKSSESIC